MTSPNESVLWEVWRNPCAGRLTIHRANGVTADSEGPTLHSREEVERFIADLRDAMEEVFP